MDIILDSATFRRFTLDMIQIGRQDMLIQQGMLKDKISQRQAFKRFGETRVKTWEERKLISSQKDKGATSTRYYSLQELTILEKSERYGK